MVGECVHTKIGFKWRDDRVWYIYMRTQGYGENRAKSSTKPMEVKPVLGCYIQQVSSILSQFVGLRVCGYLISGI